MCDPGKREPGVAKVSDQRRMIEDELDELDDPDLDYSMMLLWDFEDDLDNPPIDARIDL